MILAIVDDDDDVRRALARLLRSLGHDVRTFASAEEFEEQIVTVECAIVDVRLPGMSGLELRERLSCCTTPTPVVLITGDGDRLARELTHDEDTPSVSKPFDDAALMAAIDQAIASTMTVGEGHAS